MSSHSRGRRPAQRALAIVCAFFMLLTASGAATASPPAGGRDAAGGLSTTTPIKHLVTVMQSNHSFDSLFGAYPGVDGIPAGACMPVDPKAPELSDCVAPFAMENNGADFDHSHTTFENQYRDGRNDGFISSFRQRGEDGTLAMGHYTESDIPFSYNAADEYVIFDHFFTSASAGSVPNRMFWMTGSPGITDYDETEIPRQGWGDILTIFDLLEERGISWKVYVENYDPSITFRNRGVGGTYAQVNWVPLLSFPRFLDVDQLSAKIVDLDQYFVDLQNNDLPAVSYVITIGSSGHPPSSLQASEQLLKSMVSALMMSPAWDTSVFQWAYDDWGGWYDHVPPPQIDEFGYGFRTAAQLISPYARKQFVDSDTHDFTSILKFIEENWEIQSLASRDASALSIGTALDFAQEPRAASLIAMSRTQAVLAIPKRSGIYATYSTAILSAGAVVAWALFPRRRRRRGDR